MKLINLILTCSTEEASEAFTSELLENCHHTLLKGYEIGKK